MRTEYLRPIRLRSDSAARWPTPSIRWSPNSRRAANTNSRQMTAIVARDRTLREKIFSATATWQANNSDENDNPYARAFQFPEAIGAAHVRLLTRVCRPIRAKA